MARLQFFGYPTILSNRVTADRKATQRHRLALLALLALPPGRVQSRDKLFALLWPEADPESARQLLNSCVYVLRRALGDDALLTQRDGLSLGPAVGVDVLEFIDAVGRGDNESAVGLYRAPFLDGFFLAGAGEFDQWVSRERERLRLAYLQALESLGVEATEHGATEKAVMWWREVVRLDPFNTRAVIRLMLALERSGDHGNALQLAQEHETLLTRELAAEPTAELRNLVRRLRMRPGAAGVPAPAGPANAAGDAAATSLDAETAKRHSTDTMAGTNRWRRPRLGLLGPGVLLLALGGLALRAMSRPIGIDARRVLVVPFENVSADSALNPLRRAASAWIVDGLTRSGIIDVVESSEIGPGPSEGSRVKPAQAIARQARASFVVTGTIHARDDSVLIRSFVLDATDGRVISSLPLVVGVRHDPLTAVEEVRSRLAGALALLLDPRLGEATTGIVPPLYPAYLEYIAGIDDPSVSSHRRFFEAARIDTSFSLAIIWAAYQLDRCENAQRLGSKVVCLPVSWESLINTVEQRRHRLGPLEHAALDFAKAWRTKDSRLYYESAHAASRMVPVSFWTAHAFIASLDRGLSEEALAIMRRVRGVEPFERVFPWFNTWFLRELHLSGSHAEELNTIRGLERTVHPQVPPGFMLVRKATAFAALAMHDSLMLAAEQILAQSGGVSAVADLAREARRHGHHAAADALARRCAAHDIGRSGARCAEENGDFASARRLLESSLNSQRSQRATLLGRLGVAAALLGDTAAARRYSEAIDTVPLIAASNTRFFDNEFRAEKLMAQASIAAALREAERAVGLVRKSFDVWGRTRRTFAHDHDQRAFGRISGHLAFHQLLASLQ